MEILQTLGIPFALLADQDTGLSKKGDANMALFTVSTVIDGDTFEVSGGWKWKGQNGSRVRPTGYDAPELHEYGGQAANEKLARLILGQQVELRAAHRVDRGRLVSDVYYNGKYLADYFPEYQ
ncbi:MAG: thermonuclease family protein [Candidatus Abyssobacteria bacterium SURF_17]|uniref:Thermonuclease family protein n=1 Tax=Candidatus Abyssobacteria bacterium SURF_17 TaxID=2093361 RepID=A0A419ER77_9BACT|nr:MAG: thermonuclease family protein [Candidatus Abyssubacteria bacterium SURF_17]